MGGAKGEKGKGRERREGKRGERDGELARKRLKKRRIGLMKGINR